MTSSYFLYDTNDQFDRSITLIGDLKDNIQNIQQLMNELYSELHFPEYFGFNWDALYDCLCDFTWTDKHNIILRHKNLPMIAKDDLLIYLKILRDVVLNWREWQDHNFIVIFPESYKSKIDSILLCASTDYQNQT